MSESDLPPLPEDRDSYEQFETALVAMHQIAAPDCESGFSNRPMRHVSEDGSYYYFPHPNDRREVLEFARTISAATDDARRSLIVPAGVLSVHSFMDGSGRVSRYYHARLVGKSADEIAELEICGPRNWLGTDEEAQKVIDLRPPRALYPHIKDYVYETAEVKKQATVQPGYEILGGSVVAYKAAQGSLPENYRRDLDEVLAVSSFNSDYYVVVEDPESLEFALNAQRRNDEELAEGIEGLVKVVGSLGEDGLKRVVDDMWRFRLLRARASIECLGNTAFGSRKVLLPDHEAAVTISDHYVRLSNNLLESS